MKPLIAVVLLLCSSLVLGSSNPPPKATPFIASTGERLSFVFTIDREDGATSRQRYLEQSYALAEPLNMRAIGQFTLVDTLYGAHRAEKLAVFTLPSGKVSDAMRDSPQYAPLKDVLRKGWQDMEIIDVDLEENIQLTLFSDRYYTIAKVWVDDVARHRAYVEKAGATRAELGIRILASLTPTGYSSLDSSRTAPFLLVLVEWPAKEVIQKYLDSPVLKRIRDSDGSTIKAIEWYGFRV